MKKIILSIFVCLGINAAVSGQGTVRGKITDSNGEPAIGAVVMLKANRSLGTAADFDGNYSLKITDSTAQTLVISLMGFQTIEENVHPQNGQVVIKNFTLVPTSQQMQEVHVEAKAIKAKEYYIEEVKKKSASTIDYISSETIRKTGDANVTAAVARVTGVSTNGSFITVRGIGDRYVKTAINGSRVPTLDPFTNNIKLDLFPASLIDNVIITKTASPDLPGDFAGAYLSIETKDYPEQFTISFETSAGYNSQSTFKNVVSSQRSSTDWLGYDNSFRTHNHNTYVEMVKDPSDYQQFVALGLGDYFNGLGVTNENWNSNSDTYKRLALIQLGLLAPAQMNDDAAYQSAWNTYITGDYASRAFQIINAAVPSSGKSFPNNWNTTTRKAPLDFSQSFSIGNQTTLFGKPLGFLFGYRYGHSIKNDPNSITQRVRADGSIESSFTGPHSEEVSGWSALANLSYKFSANHSISFMFMPNFLGANKVDDIFDGIDTTRYVYNKRQFYEQRRQLVYQFKSVHFLPSTKIKADLNASYTNGKSSIPDFKNLRYIYRKDIDTYQIGGDNGDVDRFYRYLSDNLFDSHASVEFPFYSKPDLPRKLKVGGAYQRSDKESDQYDYNVQLGRNSNMLLQNNDINAYFDLYNFGIRSDSLSGIPYSTINAYYVESGSPANHTFGNSKITAGFLMCDYSVTQRLRISGGIRIEHAKLFTDVFKFDSLHYAANDSRRNYSSAYPLVNPGKLDETNYLPSINFIYKIKNDEAAPANVRLNYSSTVARPSIKELSDVALLDYEYREFVFGNSDLKTVHIYNYDLRFESWFKSGDNLSVSLFYKDFRNHIELVKSVGLTWQNVEKSHVQGIELEGKKLLGKHFEFRANVALINSESKFVRNRTDISTDGAKVYIPIDTLTRTMFGQAPYVLNGILTYSADSLGLSVTASYNVQGRRLVITSANPAIPDIYELPRHLVDVKVVKKIGKHFSAALTVRDILNTSITREYDEWNIVYDKYKYGTNYIFSVSYKL